MDQYSALETSFTNVSMQVGIVAFMFFGVWYERRASRSGWCRKLVVSSGLFYVLWRLVRVTGVAFELLSKTGC
jgi:hypothetical protein